MIRNRERRMLTAAGVAALISGLVALILLVIQLPADPAVGVTASASPFTDEGWYLLGARNQALLGVLATDDWQLTWAHLPFTVVAAAVFEVFGVGIVQARALSLVTSVASVVLVAWLVARRLGPASGIVAGIGIATCGLLLFYGRLAILEPMVMLLQLVGLVLLLAGGADRPTWRGVGAGLAMALAIGTKPSAAPAVAGIILGAVVAGRPAVPDLGRRAVVAITAIAAAGIAWAIVVISQAGVIDSILRIWAVQPHPDSPMAAVWRVVDYFGGSDGAIAVAAPLMVGAVLGTVLVAARWRSLDGDRRALAGATVGWFAFGMATLLVASYRPSRYVVPILPAMAILTGFGVALALEAARSRLGGRRRTFVLAVVVLCIGVAVRGVGDVVAWTANATYRLPHIQAELLELMTDGRAVQGDLAPTFAMRVPVPAIVSRPDLNDGDLYATRGVRWLLDHRDARPTWASDHAGAWMARERIACYPWPSGEACLTRVP